MTFITLEDFYSTTDPLRAKKERQNRQEPMKIIVCASRDWHNRDITRQALANMPEGTTIVHRGIKPADLIVAKVAEEMGYNVIEYTADRSLYGSWTHKVRDARLIADHMKDTDFVFVFIDDQKQWSSGRKLIRGAMNHDVTGILWFVDGTVRDVFGNVLPLAKTEESTND